MHPTHLLLTNKKRGWILTLAEEERLISPATAVAGVTTFATFTPDTSGGSGCGTTGTTNLYIVNTANANSLLEENGNDTRFRGIGDDFLSDTFVDRGSISNSSGSNGLCDNQADVADTLKSLFPDGCKFNNTTINLLAVLSDGGLECAVPVPVCINAKGWKSY